MVYRIRDSLKTDSQEVPSKHHHLKEGKERIWRRGSSLFRRCKLIFSKEKVEFNGYKGVEKVIV